jgi:hypothetical protein
VVDPNLLRDVVDVIDEVLDVRAGRRRELLIDLFQAPLGFCTLLLGKRGERIASTATTLSAAALTFDRRCSSRGRRPGGCGRSTSAGSSGCTASSTGTASTASAE